MKITINASWDTVKDRIFPRLLSTEWHKDLIAPLVKIPVSADIVKTFFIKLSPDLLPDELSHDHPGAHYVGITPELLHALGKTIIDLDVAAKQNTSGSYCVNTMGNLLSDMTGADISDPDTDRQMLVVTNSDTFYAAAGILDDTIIDRLRQSLGRFFVLPSSVHEVICVPQSCAPASDLAGLVRHINRTEVSASDVLSDHVFAVEDHGALVCVA